MIHIRSKLAALLVVGGAAVASAQQSNQQPAQRQGRVAGQHAGRGAHQGPGGRGAAGLFRGITLSDAEKANIKTVHTKYAAQTKALHEQYKPQHQALRDARKSGDTATVRALLQKATDEREQTKHLLDAQRADLRAALSPANQALFDANVAKVKAKVDKRVAKNGGKALKAGRRPGFRAPGA